MPLLNAQINAVISWSLYKTNTGYGNSTEGPDSLNFNWTNLNAAVNQIYVADITLAASGSTTINLQSLTNLVGESFSLGHVYGIMVLPDGAAVSVGPGASNPLTWFWGGTTQVNNVNNQSMLFHAEQGSGSGVAVTSSAKTITITNLSGSVGCVVSVAIAGSTT